MKLKRFFFLLCGMALLGAAAFTQRDEDPVEKLVASLQRWTDNNPQEKVYLHTDKPYYVVGDTMWFKAYATIGSKHQLSALSGAVYIDLIAEGDSVAKTLKLPLTAGMAKGNIILSDTAIREGNYRLRAYTQWMQNAGADYFYDRTFSVGNSAANTVFAKIDYVYSKDGAATKIKAVLKYTDQKGVPLGDKAIRYQLKGRNEIIATGGGKTSELGEISINLPNAKPGDVSNSSLLTTIAIAGDEKVVKSFPIKTAALQTDVQFFPEGGSLVNGIRSRIGFKATSANGLGASIKGVIIDGENNEVAELETKHLGMGYFQLMPERGKNYKAKITYADGSVNTMKLPDAINDGYVLSVYNNVETDTVLVRINTASATLKKQNGLVSLVAQSGGTVHYAINVPVTKAVISLPIPVKDLPSGILQFTLFSREGNPLNERIVFVQNADQMDLKLSSAKKEYGLREKVEINVDAKNMVGKPLVGNFSVSVISEDVVPSDETAENSIFSQLLLSSDIKGYIEKPNYYFVNPTAETKANLDVLMLTQGYRRFVWKDLISGKQVPAVYHAEKLVTNITGRLMGLNKKPVADGAVTLANNKLGLVLDTISDKDGRFKFSNLLITEGIDFTVQGRTTKKGKKLEVLMDKIRTSEVTPNKNIGDINSDIPASLKASMENSIRQDQDMQKHGMIGRGEELKEVRIQAKKLPKFGNTINEIQADQVFKPNDRQPCKTLKECLDKMNYNSSVFFDQVMDPNYGPMWLPRTVIGGERYAVTIDGWPIQGDDFQELLLSDLSNISRIYFVYNSYALQMRLLSNMYQGRLPPPVMAIYTKSGNFRKKYDPSIVYYTPIGYASVKEFYAPKYDRPEAVNSLADLRSTIYWNPSTITDNDGKAVLRYYNSDNKGTYRVTVEGINADGLLGRKVYRYEVR